MHALRKWSLVCVGLAAGCVPTSRAEPEPVLPLDASSVEPQPEPAPEPEATPEPEPAEPEPVEPVEEVADSKLETGFIVAATAQPGLIEFSKQLPQEGSLWIGQLDGNGGRDVLVYIPPGAKDAAEFRLVYHFHGTYSEHVEQQREGLDKKKWVGWDRLQQTIDAIRELQQTRDHNVALIYPFSAGKRLEPGHKGWSNVMYDRMWMLPAPPDPGYRDSFDTLHQEVVAILVDEFGVHRSKLRAPVLVEGHSAGGLALRNIAVAGTKLVSEYLFLDASFQGWADGCWEAIQASAAKAVITMVITDKGIADPFAGRDPWCVDLEQDAKTFAEQREQCAGEPERKPRGSEWTCAELSERAEEWKDYEDWCREHATDMQNVPEITVVRTKVVHGNQPRRFAGRLGL